MPQWSKFIGRGAVMNFGNHKRAILCPERQVSTSARRGGITFAQSSAKVIKSALSLRGPKEVIITAKVLYYLFFCTISAHLFRFFQLVLIGDYSISALCFSGGLFRTSLPLG